MNEYCALLAATSMFVASFCYADWWYDRTARNWLALMAWLGSTAFWVAMGVMGDV